MRYKTTRYEFSNGLLLRFLRSFIDRTHYQLSTADIAHLGRSTNTKVNALVRATTLDQIIESSAKPALDPITPKI
ncbi:hypothetical protein AQ859_13050 [Burkholderia pseudomallei]|nr:hypothetical protein AQ760_17520 [Burkholderia pseudomallei]OMZ16415.1 hypothetical protein AQ859_13050 [Burkholderia pseudomallei]